MTIKPLIAANWKMHKTIAETLAFLEKFKPLVNDVHEVDILICPAATSLAHCGHDLQESNIHLGSQNMFYESEGAYTGEISPNMLKEVGCTFVILGHSERRRWFYEPGLMINKKVKKALQNSLYPILCVGETEFERSEEETESVISRQLIECLDGITVQDITNITIGYEPVWAIGTGKTATPEQAQEVHEFIRNFLAQKYGQTTANKIRIVYGGSVNPENVRQIMSKKDVNGALVGTASRDPESFAKIVKFYQ